MGSLYICATPIGNLEDITLRCLKILKEVDAIAAEDTRRIVKLLNHYNITNSLISYHEHNKKLKGEEIIDLLLKGKNIALVTDAGMPTISDPGEDLVKLCVKKGISIVAIPGATASLTALSISGLSTERFVFEGFLPRKGRERKKRLEDMAKEEKTIILYEAPHRLITTLEDLAKFLGDRRISISRELTKKFEETLRFNIEEAISEFSERDIKGEFVLVIQGKLSETDNREDDYWKYLSAKEHINYLIDKGLTKKDAVSEVAKLRKLSKNEVYKISIDI